MRMPPSPTEQAILQELGRRLAAIPIERKVTQAALAEQAGVARRTIERPESGEVPTRLPGFLPVCRALGLPERDELLPPQPVPGAMTQLQQQGRRRQRATGGSAAPGAKRWPRGASE